MIQLFCWTTSTLSRSGPNKGLIIMLMFAASLFGCSSPSERLISEADGLRIYEREKAKQRICVKSLRNLIRLKELGKLPMLKVRFGPDRKLVKDTIRQAAYRIEGKHSDYYVAVNSPFFMECRENVYVAFAMPEGALVSADCS